MLTIRTILHPTDFSAQSEGAFQLACSLARDPGAEVLAVHVLTPPVVISGEGAILLKPEGQESAQEQLRRLRAMDPSVRVGHRLVEGDPATEILRLARETNCDLIVMGTHGWTGLRRLLMGSVAEQVVRRAPCPVLTVKAGQGQELSAVSSEENEEQAVAAGG